MVVVRVIVGCVAMGLAACGGAPPEARPEPPTATGTATETGTDTDTDTDTDTGTDTGTGTATPRLAGVELHSDRLLVELRLVFANAPDAVAEIRPTAWNAPSREIVIRGAGPVSGARGVAADGNVAITDPVARQMLISLRAVQSGPAAAIVALTLARPTDTRIEALPRATPDTLSIRLLPSRCVECSWNERHACTRFETFDCGPSETCAREDECDPGCCGTPR